MEPYYKVDTGVLYCGDVFDILPQIESESVNCCITSPPYYGLRDYGNASQIGLEQTPEEYVSKLVAVFREIKRILRNDGTLWLNLGDSYAGGGGGNWGSGLNTTVHQSNPSHLQNSKRIGCKTKDLIGIPWMVAFALRSDGWYLRQDIIWHKPNPMPESVTDRCTKAHEYIFLLSKSQRYFYDAEAIREDGPIYIRKASGYIGFDEHHTGSNQRGGFADKDTITIGRNKRSVWTVTTKPFKEAHFATFPEALIQPCILAGCPEDGVVIDPFSGACTTSIVAEKHFKKWIAIELNQKYCEISKNRIEKERELTSFLR